MPADARTALIVVDMQNAFVAPSAGLSVDRAEEVVAEVNAWVAHARRRSWPVLYTRDVAPTELPAGDPDHQTHLYPGLEVHGTVVPKGPGKHGGFSGFVLASTAVRDGGGPGGGGLSGLAGLLEAAAVEHIVVVGLAADVCVAATARDARRLGYQATMPLEATAFVHAHPAGDESALADLAAAEVRLREGGPSQGSREPGDSHSHSRQTGGQAMSASPRGSRRLPRSEWGTQRVDLDAYLDRIGHDAPLRADHETLRRLHRAHLATIPFENLDIVLGRGVSLDPEHLQDKLVRRRRGGYCYEHNLLFAAVLERVGFSVTRLLARVNPAKPGPRSHMALRVELDGAGWLADVGFGGGGPLEPLALDPPTPVNQGAWTYQLDAGDAGRRVLRTHAPDGWSDLYAFTLEAQHAIDFDVANHYTSTNPGSPFVGKLVAQRNGPETRHRLTDRTLATATANVAVEEREVDPGELGDVLSNIFGIEVTELELDALRRHLTSRAS